MPCKFHVALLVGAAVVGASMGACGREPVQVGGELPAKVYTRIVSLSPSTTELLAMLNQEQKLVGRTSACNIPETIRDRPIVANPAPDVETIIKLQPHLVIADGHLFRPDSPAITKLREAGIEVRLLVIDSIQDWVREVVALGNLLMEQPTASKEIDRLNVSMGKGKIQPPPKVLVAMGGDRPMVAGVRSFQADVVKAAGGVPVGPDATEFVIVNLEQVLQWNPDIMFVSDDPNEYLENPVWARTAAGKNKRVVNVNPDTLLRPGARVADLIAALNDRMRGMMSGAGSREVTPERSPYDPGPSIRK